MRLCCLFWDVFLCHYKSRARLLVYNLLYIFVVLTCHAVLSTVSKLKDVIVFFNRKVDSGDYKPEDYRVMQSDGYRQRLVDMRQRLGFGCGVDTFKDMISGLPAGEVD